MTTCNSSSASSGDLLVKRMLEKQIDLNRSLIKFLDIRRQNRIENERSTSTTSEKRKKATVQRNFKEKQRSVLDGVEEEMNAIRRCLADIGELRGVKDEHVTSNRYGSTAHNSSTLMRRGALMLMLHKTAASLPLFLGQDHDQHFRDPPALCGSMQPSSSDKIDGGQLVAALVKSDEGDCNWILARVKGFDERRNEYEVEDIDEEQMEVCWLPRKRVVALPLWRAHPDIHPQCVHPPGDVVWALYPQTTCFYRGLVQRSLKKASDQYLVAFEDHSFPSGYSPPLPVHQRYIFPEQR